MNVKEIMANVVQMVDRTAPLEKVASIMKDYDIGCVVVGTRDKMEGLVTDRDIVCRAVASGKPLKSMNRSMRETTMAKMASFSIQPSWVWLQQSCMELLDELHETGRGRDVPGL